MTTTPLKPIRIALLVLSIGVFFFAVFSISVMYFWQKGDNVYNFYTSSFELGVLMATPVVLVRFLFRTNIMRLSYSHLSVPSLFVIAAFIVALLYSHRTLDAETWMYAVIGVGILYLATVGFLALSRRINRSLGAYQDITSLRSHKTMLPPALLTYLMVLVILLVGVWLIFSWITTETFDSKYIDLGEGSFWIDREYSEFPSPRIFLIGSLLPLYIALVVILSSLLFPMADDSRRDLYWILALFGTVVVLLGTLLTVLAFIDEPRRTIFPLLTLATLYGWGIWVMIALFRFLYPLPQSTVTRQSNHGLTEE